MQIAIVSKTFCQIHDVHVPKWEWKDNLATWIYTKITPKTNKYNIKEKDKLKQH